jgi:uncharacterized damage-inducible protein DinB
MPDALVLTPAQLLDHWQGHRRLTRRIIEAFPSDEAYATFSVGGMRPAAGLIAELLHMAVPILRGVATGEWASRERTTPATRAEALAAWDADTAEIDAVWATLPDDAFQKVTTAFGQWEGPGHWQFLYAIDNEVHHRSQAYVYLRALGVEPPPFYDRS